MKINENLWKSMEMHADSYEFSESSKVYEYNKGGVYLGKTIFPGGAGSTEITDVQGKECTQGSGSIP